MSYFAVLSGNGAASVDVAAGTLVPIEAAQSYLASLALEIAEQDGTPSYFWDDNETGTSHEIICAAEDALREGAFDQSALSQLIHACEQGGFSLRVWWAANDRDAFLQVPQTRTAAETYSLLQPLSNGPHTNVCFALRPNYSVKWTAAVGPR
jgi:hypothetical protein